MKSLMNFKLVNTIIATSSLVLVLGIHCNDAFATSVSIGSVRQLSDKNSVNYTDQIVAAKSTGTERENDGGTGYKDNDESKGSAPVPEPGTFLLVSAGLFGLAIYFKRHENKSEAYHK